MLALRFKLNNGVFWVLIFLPLILFFRFTLLDYFRHVQLYIWFHINWFYRMYDFLLDNLSDYSIIKYIKSSINFELFYFYLLLLLLFYLLFSIMVILYYRFIGVRGFFMLSQLCLINLFFMFIISILFCLRFHISPIFILGNIYLSNFIMITCIIRFDLLSLIGGIVVLILTILTIFFGIEYLANEMYMLGVMYNIFIFSACVTWFIFSYSLSLLLIFWELSGFFSLLLIDTYYNRVRTTQAVSRTFIIGRLSDFTFLIGISELFLIFGSDNLAIIFLCLKRISTESSILLIYFFETLLIQTVLFSFFITASCKCAQFLLFVWLPDAMEAPTPASALIHSSTLVVLGIFLLFKLVALFSNCTTVLNLILFTGCITIVYGSVFSIYTSDLKKAVAYSTISQVGYLFCGFGFLALHETLVYLVLHAICKALLFIFVGYLVHFFGGTTSIRKMGGVFFQIPHIGIGMFIVCTFLAGLPYTAGFVMKEFLVQHIFSTNVGLYYFVLFCWIISFICTPVYLMRICILPVFGKIRSSWFFYKKNILSNTKNFNKFNFKDFFLYKNTSFFFFSSFYKTCLISSRFSMYMHYLVLVFILFFGEFIILLIFGFFGSIDLVFYSVFLNYSNIYGLSLIMTSFRLLTILKILLCLNWFTLFLYLFIDYKVFSINVFKVLSFVLFILFVGFLLVYFFIIFVYVW